MTPIQSKIGRNWPGVLVIPVLVIGLLALGTCSGCSMTSVRLGIEAGKGDLQADTIGMKGRMDTKLDADVDGAALPLSEFGGE